MKILLLNPPGTKIYIRDYYCSKVSKTNYIYEPPDLLILSGILSEKHRVAVIDAIAEKLSENDCIARILQFRPDAIVFLSGAVSFQEDFPFMEKVKRLTNAKLIGSADIFMENGEKILEKYRFIDALLLDFTTPDILAYLEGKNAQNIIYRAGDRIIKTKTERIKLANFTIPIPKHELFPLHKYRFPFAYGKFATVLTDYGCPFRCKFCIMSNLGFKFRSAENVIAELQYIKSLGINEIYFDDQTFGVNRKRTIDLCNAMLANNLQMKWSCFSRVDLIDEEILTLMKNAGCHTIMFGVESSNEEILRKYEKGFTIAQVEKTFALCRKLGIRTLATFMLGFPEESEESVINTIEFSKRLNPDYAAFNVPVPRAATQLRKEEIAEHLIADELLPLDQTGSFVEISTKQIPAERLASLRKRAVKEFYLRPSYIARRILSIRSFAELKNNISDALALLQNA